MEYLLDLLILAAAGTLWGVQYAQDGDEDTVVCMCDVCAFLCCGLSLMFVCAPPLSPNVCFPVPSLAPCSSRGFGS